MECLGKRAFALEIGIYKDRIHHYKKRIFLIRKTLVILKPFNQI